MFSSSPSLHQKLTVFQLLPSTEFMQFLSRSAAAGVGVGAGAHGAGTVRGQGGRWPP
jgi:putative effector of murein hydrolase